MEVLKRPAWWVPLVAFLLHQLAERIFDYTLPALDNHLDAFVSVPILLGLHLAEQRKLFGVQRLSVLHIFLAVCLFAIIFEGVFPLWEPDFTADWWDILAYGAGAAYFGFFLNR